MRQYVHGMAEEYLHCRPRKNLPLNAVSDTNAIDILKIPSRYINGFGKPGIAITILISIIKKLCTDMTAYEMRRWKHVRFYQRAY
jgi:hypothetical protein